MLYEFNAKLTDYIKRTFCTASAVLYVFLIVYLFKVGFFIDLSQVNGEEAQERGCHAARHVRYISLFISYVPKTVCGLFNCEKQLTTIESFWCFMQENVCYRSALTCTITFRQ